MGKQLKGWLIYKKDDAERNEAFISMLLEEAGSLDIKLQLVFDEDISCGIEKNELSIFHKKYNLMDIQFAIVRTINPLLTKQLEFLGIRCFNHSTISELCNDKALTYQFVSKLGIKTLDSYFITKNTFPFDRTDLLFPMVLKQADGRGGKQVNLVTSNVEIKDQLIMFPDKRFVLQQFSDNPGKDIRVFVIGKKIIGAVLRESDTSFKANFSLGGHASFYHLNVCEAAIVNKIIFALDADFIGIDFLLNKKNEFLFNEIEDVVGCRSLYATSPINAASLFIEHIKQSLTFKL